MATKTFDQYLAESGQQSTLDQLRKAGQYDTAKSQYESTGSYGVGGGQSVQSSSYAQPNFESTLQRALEIQKQAVQPAVSSLQASIPEIQQGYAQQRQFQQGQVSSLTDRYKNLIDTIKTNQQASETATTKTTSQELGKRGIVGSSTLAGQTINEAVSPIRSQYSNLLSQTGIAQEADIAAANQQLANLATAETEAIRNVNNAIAQLQGATTQAGVNQALQQLQLAQSEASRIATEKANADQMAFQQKVYQETTLPESQYAVNRPYSTADNSGMSVSDLLSLFGGGTQMQSTGFSNVDNLIAQGKFDEARALLLNP